VYANGITLRLAILYDTFGILIGASGNPHRIPNVKLSLVHT
jgi:hypothetical protein